MKLKHLLSATALTTLVLPSAVWAQEKTTTLDAMVVTATRAQEAKREVTTNVTVIEARDIQNSTAKNMAELMTQQGFQVINQGTQKILKIRGMGQRSMVTEMSSEILVLLNGRRIGVNNMALMGLDNIDHVEIIRGPSAVQFGPSAMGGVVNIITRRGTEKIQAGLEAGVGSFGLNKEAVNLSGAANGFDFSGAATQLGRDDYDISGGDRWKRTSLDSSITSNLDLGYTFLKTHRVGLNFNYYDQKDARSPGTGWSGTGAINNSADYNEYDLRNYNMAFTYEGKTEDGLFDWMARYSFGQDKSDGKFFSSSYGDSWADNVLDNKSATAQVGYNGSILALNVGLDYLRYDYDQKGSYTNNESKYDDLGVYMAAKLRFFDERLIFSLGGRYDKYDIKSDSMSEDRDDHNFSPSLGVAVLPVYWLKLRGNYSQGFRMPTPTELTGDGWRTLANYDLDPEKSKTFEIGADISWEFVDAGLTYFHTDWDDKIIGVQLGSNTWQNRNLDGGTIAGFELSLKADIGKALEQDFELTPYVNVTYLTRRKSDDHVMNQSVGSDTMINTPKTAISFGVTFNHPGYEFMTNVNATYFSSTISRDWRYNSPTSGKYVKNDGDTVFDVSLQKGLFKFGEYGSLGLRAEVNNIFDSDNENYLDYPGMGRNFYVGLRYTYNY